MSAITAFSKAIGPVAISVIVKESHESEIGITSDPIETGAEVNDHAYLMPKKVTLEIADKNGAATFNALVRFQESRVPFNLVTGLTVYKNMLVKRITPDRDKDNSSILQGSVDLQEIIIVDTAYASAQADEDDEKLSGTKRGGPGGEKSTRATRPTASNTGDATTSDKAAATVARGDSPTTTVPPEQSKSILTAITGG